MCLLIGTDSQVSDVAHGPLVKIVKSVKKAITFPDSESDSNYNFANKKLLLIVIISCSDKGCSKTTLCLFQILDVINLQRQQQP